MAQLGRFDLSLGGVTCIPLPRMGTGQHHRARRWQPHCMDSRNLVRQGVPLRHDRSLCDRSALRCVGHGFGRLLANTLRAELQERLGLMDIVFAERSTRYIEAGYGAFFHSLGATETTRPGWRSEWLWRGEP
jgi:hypothetical protein